MQSPTFLHRLKAEGGPIFTVGHSNRSLEDFLSVLHAYNIGHLVDVRKIPRSGHNPQFGQDKLSEALTHEHIIYTHLPGLGGLRHTQPDSLNGGWQNASFRAFADYMQTPEFTEHLERLIQIAVKEQAAIMCAEAVPWRCHRRLIADALVIRDYQVVDILNATHASPHLLTSFAHVDGLRITYPSVNIQQTLF
ncbi:MAG: DUF488 domain-containing protein [Aggregatilineales bacterium]